MPQRFLKTAGTVVISMLPVLFSGILPETARGQIILNDGNGLAEFSAYGIPVNTNFVTALSTPQGIAISGSNIFVANFGNGTIGEYTLSGAIVNTNLISGLSSPEGIALSGTNLFVANYENGTIGEYTTSGATNNAHLISGLITPAGLAISGSNLFVAEYGRNRIGEYTLSGAVVNSNLIAPISTANGIAISGNLLFVARGTGAVGEYTTSGATNNFVLFGATSSYSTFGIAVLPDTGLSVPAPLAISMTATNASVLWPTNAFAYQLQSSPSLDPATWTLVTNTPVVTNASYSINLSRANTAQFFRLQSIN